MVTHAAACRSITAAVMLVLILLMKSLLRRLSVLVGDMVRGCWWWCYTPRLSVGGLPQKPNGDSWRADGAVWSRQNDDDEDWVLSVRAAT